MKKESELKKILQIAIPSTIAWIGHMFYNVADNIMIGKLIGSEGLAISGLAGSIYYIFLVFGMGASSILTALFSEALAKNIDEIKKIFHNGLVISFIIGLIIFIILFYGNKTLIMLFNKQVSLNLQIEQYLKILSFVPIFVMIFFTFERMCEGLNKAKIAMYTVLICNILNILMNYIFITGAFGFYKMGIYGAAFSTLINSFFEVVIIFIFVKKNFFLKQIIIIQKKYFSFSFSKTILLLGAPAGILYFLESTAFNITSFIASKVSINDIAAHQILIWIIALLLTPVFGVSTAMTARIAYNVEVNNYKLAFKIGQFSILITAFYVVIIMFLFFIFQAPILNSMLKGTQSDLITIKLISNLLLLMIVIEMFDGIQVMAGAVLRGYKDTSLPAIFAFISYWLICLPLAYFFGDLKQMGVSGIWIGIGAAVFFQSILFYLRFYLKYKN